MKKALLIVGVLLALGAIVFASFKAGDRGKGEKVYAEAASRQDIVQRVKASGEVDAKEKVNISSHLIGKIEKLYVEEGDDVAAGQPFLELEKEAFVAARDDWRSRLQMALNDVEQAKVSLADARLKGERARRLSADGIITPEQLESAELTLTSGELQLQRSEEGVTQARANLEKASTDLAKTTLYSPIAGRVVALNAEEGEVVVSGTMNNPASIIGTIADLSEILAVVDVDETEIVLVSVGQQADLQVDAVPDKVYQGRVVEVGSSGYSLPRQPDVTFFRVKVLFAAPDESLRPGMSVRADVAAASRPDALVVPIAAVVDRPPLKAEAKGREDAGSAEAAAAPAAGQKEEEGPVVFAIEDGKARQKSVTTGLSDETHVEITSGLEAGAEVVTGPYRVLKDLDDGDAVQIRSADDDKRDKDKAKDGQED
jgi:HlyD family secretion protein